MGIAPGNLKQRRIEGGNERNRPSMGDGLIRKDEFDLMQINLRMVFWKKGVEQMIHKYIYQLPN